MKIKNFNDYSNFYSRDPKNFEKRVALISHRVGEKSLFEKLSEMESLFTINRDLPVIVWNEKGPLLPEINEHFKGSVYNTESLPSSREILDVFKEEPFVIKKVSDRSLVKKMNFPIIGVRGDSEDEFNTYGKFKKSERQFDFFKEKILPSSRFEVLASGKTPIHVHKKINKTPFDVDIKRWDHLDAAKNICSKVSEVCSPEFYIISLIESNGKLYLESINRDQDLTPPQEFSLYEAAYSKYYRSSLPNWFKKKAFNDHVKPYYAKKHYDSLLFKPTGVIDYKKYID